MYTTKLRNTYHPCLGLVLGVVAPSSNIRWSKSRALINIYAVFQQHIEFLITQYAHYKHFQTQHVFVPQAMQDLSQVLKIISGVFTTIKSPNFPLSTFKSQFFKSECSVLDVASKVVFECLLVTEKKPILVLKYCNNYFPLVPEENWSVIYHTTTRLTNKYHQL